MSRAFAAPTEWWLEIPSDIQAECWQASQGLARRQFVYLNQLCLRVFWPWFGQEYAAETAVWPDIEGAASLWELVEGSCLTLGSQRVVLIPTASIDTAELEVPQEWVDIADWAADYYLAIQLDPDEGWLRVWGYATHQLLKCNAMYDPVDRTYCLAANAVIRDLGAFWGVCQFCPETKTRCTLSLPTLTNTEAQLAIDQLSQPEAVFPRLVLPFEQWGAILSHPGWRQQLCETRLKALKEPQKVAMAPRVTRPSTHLSSWLEGQVSGDWQPLDLFLGKNLQLLSQRSVNVSISRQERGKFITLNAESEPQTLLLFMALHTETDGRVGIRVQLHPMSRELKMPSDLVLAIYSASNQLLQSIQSQAQADYIRSPYFRCLPGTQFRLHITCHGDTFSEAFAV